MRTMAGLAALAVLTLGCQMMDRAETNGVPGLVVAEASFFAPLPAVLESPANPGTREKVDLGRMLYYDSRFSVDGKVSCYVCHPLHDYGTTHRATGVGHGQLAGTRNEPTVYNAGGHVAQFWDGRAPDLEAQALGPVLNPVEMGMTNGPAVLKTIRSIPGYVEAFHAAFPGQAEPVTFENFGRAIAAFERGLLTPARWDAYLNGQGNAITEAEKQGLRTFVGVGCVQCHSGAYVGGTMYSKAGLVQRWPEAKDAGRYAVTRQVADRQVFKVPALRNVEETWPYFHDGSVQRLDDAIVIMARHQLGRELTPDQVQQIRTWLLTLTGSVPTEYIRNPVLPPGQ